jgi:membrane protease YdiL (CAAX protease family)
MKRHPLLWFFILTFVITWGLAAFYFAANAIFDNPLGEMSISNPLFILAVWGPNIAAFIIVGITDGVRGIVRLLKKFIPKRTHVFWYVIVIFLFPLAGIMINMVTETQIMITEMPRNEAITLLLAILVSGPIGEELGWRGYALPRILKNKSAIYSAILLGLPWGIWHFPSFFMSGLPQAGAQIPAFLLAAISLSIFVTWVFVNTGHNVFFSFLVHYSVNFTYMLIGSNPLHVSFVQVLVAILIFLLFGKDLQLKGQNLSKNLAASTKK